MLKTQNSVAGKLISVLVIIFLSASAVFSQEQFYTPPQLEPWIRWVKDRHPEWKCAGAGNARECEWYGRCRLEFKEKGVKFTLSGELMNEGAIRLVGSTEYPPAKLKAVNNEGKEIAALVHADQGAFYIKLPEGSFTVEGELQWETMPHEIPVPDQYALIQNSGSLPSAKQSARFGRGNNTIWFNDEQQTAEIDKISLAVARRLIDGSPLIVESILDLNISGGSRSVNFGKVIPDGSTVVGINSPLPYQLTSAGVLSVQVAPGNYQVKVTSALQQPVDRLTSKVEMPEIWPSEETWIWTPNNSFRTVSVSGGTALSSDSALIPPDWNTDAGYVVNPQTGIELKELSRGDSSARGDNLSLQKTLWLDLSGQAFTVRDYFSGSLKTSDRLNVGENLQLGRATINSKPALITSDPASQKAGVEIRDENLALETVSRMERSGAYKAIGWDQNVQQLSLQLNLPPFWKIFTVSGIAGESASWLGSWSLLEVFLLILLVIGTSRLLGKITASLVAATLLLNHNEFLEPRMLLFHILIASVMCKLLEGQDNIFKKISRVYFISSILLWCAEALTLSKLQLTQILYPQLEAGTRYRTLLQQILLVVESSPYHWLFIVVAGYFIYFFINRFRSKSGFINGFVNLAMIAALIFMLSGMLLSQSVGVLSRTAGYQNIPAAPVAKSYNSYELEMDGTSAVGRADKLKEYQPQQNEPEVHAEKVQTGPALPQWRWRTFYFSFAGPVSSGHEINFILLSPFVNQILSILRLVCVLLLMLSLLKKICTTGLKDLLFNTTSAAKPLAVLLLIILPKVCLSQLPDRELLAEMEARMQSEICAGEKCSVISELDLRLDNQSMSLTAEVTSDGTGTILLPGPLTEYQLKSVLLDDKETDAFKNTPGGFLAVRVPSGKSRLNITALVGDSHPFTLQFPSIPVSTNFSSTNWKSEGISGSGSVKSSVRFIPQKQNTLQITETKAELGNWFTITRRIEIGERNRIYTQITKLGDSQEAAVLKLQLIADEQIVEGAYVGKEGDKALIKFPAGSTQISLTSSFSRVEKLQLKAESQSNVSYVWQLNCSQYVHCSYGGLPVNLSSNSGAKISTWMPFPHDTLDIDVLALRSLPGVSLTADELTHTVNWGAGTITGNVSVKVRNTAQNSFWIEIPQELRIKSLTLDNQSAGAIAKGQVGSYLLQPGEHLATLDYEGEWYPANMQVTPLIKTSSEANNVSVKVKPSLDRWILWTGGIAWGPAVLIWAKLLIVILLVAGLSYYRLINISLINSLLLAIGLTTLPSLYLIFPLVWLCVMNLTEVNPRLLNRSTKTVRQSLFVLLTLVALAQLYSIVESGLVFQPPMLIVGNNSTAYLLNWYIDHIQTTVPQSWVLSISIFWWRTLMIVWSTWLVINLLSWLRRAIEAVKKLNAGAEASL